MVQKSFPESANRGPQGAPVLSDHTPTPWRASKRYIGTANHMSYIGECRDQNGNWTNEPMALANAAFIVRAVNSHEVLVKALEKIAALDPPRTDLIGAVKLARHIAKCALASAREAQP